MTANAPLRVLIVDDEAPARNRIRDLLADCAFQMPLEIAGEAENGRSALAMLPECGADVVLLDIRMPEMDGLEVAQHLQKLDEPPAVVLMLASASKCSARRSRMLASAMRLPAWWSLCFRYGLENSRCTWLAVRWMRILITPGSLRGSMP